VRRPGKSAALASTTAQSFTPNQNGTDSHPESQWTPRRYRRRIGETNRLEHLQSRPPNRSQSDLRRAGQKNVPSRAPQRPFLSGAARYGVRRPEPVPVPQGTHRARRTQRNERRGGAGPTRQRLGRSTATYVATVQLPGSGTVALATASTTRQPRRNGAPTPRKSNRCSLRLLRRRSSALNKTRTYAVRTPPFIQASIRHLQRR
jgi:hypothetical protein